VIFSCRPSLQAKKQLGSSLDFVVRSFKKERAMPDAKPKYSRELPAERQRKLIEATRRCLAELGVAGTSVREIASRAKVSPGLVSHHFKGKEDLIARTYEAIAEELNGILQDAMEEAGESAHAQLKAFVRTSIYPPILDAELLAVWISFWNLVRVDERIAAIHRRTYADYRAGITRLIEEMAEERGIAVRAERAALGLSALLDGLWIEWCLDPSAFSAAEARRIAEDWLDALADGHLHKA
jgi:TetR/AcrR family transcriptional repressor of bet genes